MRDKIKMEENKIIDIVNRLVKEDFLEGPMSEVIDDLCETPEEVKPFIKGVKAGAAYALGLIVSGKLDLTVKEKGESDVDK